MDLNKFFEQVSPKLVGNIGRLLIYDGSQRVYIFYLQGNQILPLSTDSKMLIKSLENPGTGATTVISDPPKDKYPVTNLYVDPVTNKLVVEYDNLK